MVLDKFNNNHAQFVKKYQLIRKWLYLLPQNIRYGKIK